MERKLTRRIQEIDALRGIAALMVLLGHYTINYDHLHGLNCSLGFHFWPGNFGVFLFFVISGFVIDLTLHRCRTGLDFGVSRFSRIFPAYWGALIITCVLLHLLGAASKPSLVQTAVSFTMLERFLGFAHLDEVYWTLNVELSFYIWMFFVFKLRALDKIESIIPFVLVFQWAMELGARYTHHTFSQGMDVVFLLEYAHMFCAGMLFYRIWDDGRLTFRRALLLTWCYFNHACVDYRVFDWTVPNIYGLPALLIVYAIMLAVIAGRLKWLATPVLLFFGTISYTLYLLHNHLGSTLRECLTRHGIGPWPGFLSALAMTLVLATALTFLVEKPAMKWIRQRYKQWQPAGRP